MSSCPTQLFRHDECALFRTLYPTPAVGIDAIVNKPAILVEFGIMVVTENDDVRIPLRRTATVHCEFLVRAVAADLWRRATTSAVAFSQPLFVS